MKRLILAACLALPACTPGSIVSAPAPLAQTAIDEKGLTLVWTGFNAALDGINILRRTGVIKDGSPTARGLADLIDKTTLALTAASAAQRAGNATSYIAAMSDAQAALTGIRGLLKGN